MSAMAQALAKAGLADKEKAANIDKEREFLREKYYQISKSIGDLFRRKKDLNTLSEAVKNPGKEVSVEDLTEAVKRIFGITITNFNAKSNQLLVLGKIKDELAAVEKLVRPMLKSTKKLEKEWGFERPKRN